MPPTAKIPVRAFALAFPTLPETCIYICRLFLASRRTMRPVQACVKTVPAWKRQMLSFARRAINRTSIIIFPSLARRNLMIWKAYFTPRRWGPVFPTFEIDFTSFTYDFTCISLPPRITKIQYVALRVRRRVRFRQLKLDFLKFCR